MVIWRSLRGSRAIDHVATALRSNPIAVLAATSEKDHCPPYSGSEKGKENSGEDEVPNEAEWDWIVESASLGTSKDGNDGSAGGYTSGDSPDGFLICDAPRAINREELNKQLAPREDPSDTGSAPTTMSARTTRKCGSSGGDERGSEEDDCEEDYTLSNSGLGDFSVKETTAPETPPPPSPSPTTTSSAAKLVAGLLQMGNPKEKHILDDGYYCRCNAPGPILMRNEIESDSYRAMTGKGYLASAARNIALCEDEQEVVFTSGKYTIRDAACMVCGVTLGTKYVGADHSENHYKVGKFLLSQDLLVSGKDLRKNQ